MTRALLNAAGAESLWRKKLHPNSWILYVFIVFQLDFVNALLQELSSHTDSSGEQLEGTDKKEEEEVDEDDLAEKAKLPIYVSRFEVSSVKFVIKVQLGFTVVFLAKDLHCFLLCLERSSGVF